MLHWLGRKEKEFILADACKHNLFPSTAFLIPTLVWPLMEQEQKLLVSDSSGFKERENLKSPFTGEIKKLIWIHWKFNVRCAMACYRLCGKNRAFASDKLWFLLSCLQTMLTFTTSVFSSLRKMNICLIFFRINKILHAKLLFLINNRYHCYFCIFSDFN